MGLFYALPDAAGRNPNWPALGIPGPVTEPTAPAQAPKTIASRSSTVPRRPCGRTCDRRLRRGRRRDRGRPTGQGPAGRRARALGLPKRAGLPSARGRGCPGYVPARRALLVGDRFDRNPRRRDARRRHGHQLDDLPAPAGRHPRGVGGRRARGARRPHIRRAPRRGLDADQRQHRAHDPEPGERAHGGGARGARALVGDAAAQCRGRRRPDVLWLL